MEIGFISIDTNVLQRARFNFDAGILRQLRLFKSKAVKLVFTEIVVRETKNHILKELEEDLKALKTAISKIDKNQNLKTKLSDRFAQLLEMNGNPEIIVDARVEEFFRSTKSEIIPSSFANLETIINDYFSLNPPFESSADKKNEFPDAIALSSLENWAKSQGIKGVVVSNDKGWGLFAEKSNVLFFESDLSKVLESILEPEDILRMKVEKYLSKIFQIENDTKEFHAIRSSIENEIEDLDVEFLMDTDFSHYEAYHHETKVETISPIYSDERTIEFSIISQDKNVITVDLPLKLSLLFIPEFEFFIWDSIDKEELSAGYKQLNAYHEVTSSLIIELEIVNNSVHGIKTVEVITIPEEVDLGSYDRSDFYGYSD